MRHSPPSAIAALADPITVTPAFRGVRHRLPPAVAAACSAARCSRAIVSRMTMIDLWAIDGEVRVIDQRLGEGPTLTSQSIRSRRSLLRICLARLLAAKIEFKTIASKITQHPAVTIESIKLRRHVITPFIQTRLSGGGAAAGTQAATPNHAGTHGCLRGAHRPIRHDCRTIEFWASPATKLAR